MRGSQRDCWCFRFVGLLVDHQHYGGQIVGGLIEIHLQHEVVRQPDLGVEQAIAGRLQFVEKLPGNVRKPTDRTKTDAIHPFVGGLSNDDRVRLERGHPQQLIIIGGLGLARNSQPFPVWIQAHGTDSMSGVAETGESPTCKTGRHHSLRISRIGVRGNDFLTGGTEGTPWNRIVGELPPVRLSLNCRDMREDRVRNFAFPVSL